MLQRLSFVCPSNVPICWAIRGQPHLGLRRFIATMAASDLERKLEAFQDFYNVHRAHAALEGRTPVPTRKDVARLDRYGWQAHCRGLYQTPIAA